MTVWPDLGYHLGYHPNLWPVVWSVVCMSWCTITKPQTCSEIGNLLDIYMNCCLLLAPGSVTFCECVSLSIQLTQSDKLSFLTSVCLFSIGFWVGTFIIKCAGTWSCWRRNTLAWSSVTTPVPMWVLHLKRAQGRDRQTRRTWWKCSLDLWDFRMNSEAEILQTVGDWETWLVWSLTLLKTRLETH